jgi:hypothetical protein
MEAERIAVEDAVLSVAAAASAEWMGLAAGERPWIIEVQAPNGVDMAAIAGTSSGGEVVVLEDRPGIGALMRVPGDVARQIESGPSAGKVLHRRPGFLLIAGGGFEHGNLEPWWWGGSALLAVVVVLGAIAWRMKRESARQIAPREPRD